MTTLSIILGLLFFSVSAQSADELECTIEMKQLGLAYPFKGTLDKTTKVLATSHSFKLIGNNKSLLVVQGGFDNPQTGQTVLSIPLDAKENIKFSTIRGYNNIGDVVKLSIDCKGDIQDSEEADQQYEKVVFEEGQVHCSLSLYTSPENSISTFNGNLPEANAKLIESNDYSIVSNRSNSTTNFKILTEGRLVLSIDLNPTGITEFSKIQGLQIWAGTSSPHLSGKCTVGEMIGTRPQIIKDDTSQTMVKGRVSPK